jgi:methyltransferase family protein
MLGLPARYFLSHPARAIATIASDPFEIWTIVQQNYVAQRERPVPADLYQADLGWDRRMHELLGVPWPCEAASESAILWSQVMAELETKGIRVGPETLHGWNDGDAGLARAIWCLTRHLRPHNVVETGVLHGVTSRFILEALERNRAGHLWSIDLPPLEPVRQDEIGIAVGDRFRPRWSYIKGTSKRRLPDIISKLGQIDLFIHDSLHSEENVRFEIDRAFAALRPGGAIVVDDIDANWGFRTFTQAFSGCQSMICEAEPLRPDLRRFNKKGLFGIILKEQAQARVEN